MVSTLWNVSQKRTKIMTCFEIRGQYQVHIVEFKLEEAKPDSWLPWVSESFLSTVSPFLPAPTPTPCALWSWRLEEFSQVVFYLSMAQYLPPKESLSLYMTCLFKSVQATMECPLCLCPLLPIHEGQSTLDYRIVQQLQAGCVLTACQMTTVLPSCKVA